MSLRIKSKQGRKQKKVGSKILLLFSPSSLKLFIMYDNYIFLPRRRAPINPRMKIRYSFLRYRFRPEFVNFFPVHHVFSSSRYSLSSYLVGLTSISIT